jgi:signal transduction histidine kinase
MRDGPPSGDHGRVTSALTGIPRTPRVYRRATRKVLGGVAGGLADHLRIPPSRMRLVFALLALADGLGFVLYGAYWIVLQTPPGSPRRSRFDWLGYAAGAVIMVAGVFTLLRVAPLGRLFIPSALAVFGGALIWRQASEPQRERWWQISRSSLGSAGRQGLTRLAVGAVLVVTGAAFVLARSNLSATGDGLVAVAVTIIGLALLTGPWWMRTVTELGNERRERIRSQERAELAAHLHDSVLQTLALIQRNAGSPREVSRLARGQERELRTLLYGARSSSGQLSDALKAVAAEVEDAYAIEVEVVVVGDVPMTDPLAALVGASREALVNAAKHAGVATVSLYAEVEADAVTAFVKDRGVGFDAETIGEDRQGVRGSIIGRVERHGGRANVRSARDRGTEIEIRMPR